MAGKVTPTPKGISDRGPSKKAPKMKPIVADRVSIGGPKGERSVSVRQIENGYIVSEHNYDRKGGYKHVERYCEEPPMLQVRATTKNKKY